MIFYRYAFNTDAIEVGKKYIYLKNERTGSSTIRKVKMVGEVVAFKNQKVILKRLISPEKIEWERIGCEDSVFADDVICGITDEQIHHSFWGLNYGR